MATKRKTTAVDAAAFAQLDRSLAAILAQRASTRERVVKDQ
jgi:hypothetical protein